MTYGLEGLDMKSTIEWYSNVVDNLPQIIPGQLDYPICQSQYIEASPSEIAGIIGLFPKNAVKRSLLVNIIGKPSHWFHKDSSPKGLIPTPQREEALLETALIPLYADYSKWFETKKPQADIWLYQIPSDLADSKVRKIILYEGFIHEFAHTLSAPDLYGVNETLQLPDGSLMEAATVGDQFKELAAKYSPISHYSSTYRNKAGKFESDDPDYNLTSAVSEELAECITARLLGFTYCAEEYRRLQPFADRPDVKTFIDDYLNAKKLS